VLFAMEYTVAFLRHMSLQVGGHVPGVSRLAGPAGGGESCSKCAGMPCQCAQPTSTRPIFECQLGPHPRYVEDIS